MLIGQRAHFDLKRAREGRLGGMFWSMYVSLSLNLSADALKRGMEGAQGRGQELIASFTECTTEIEGPEFLNATNGVRGKPLVSSWM